MLEKFIKTLKNDLRDSDKVLLFITIILFILGLLNIVTASSKSVVVIYNIPLYTFFFKQGEILLAGFIFSLIIITIPTKYYKSLIKILFLFIGVCLVYLLIYGSFHMGNKNWLNIPIFGKFQPSEFSKPIMIIALATYFENVYFKLKDKKRFHYDLIARILFIGTIFPIIIFLQKDLGTMIVTFLIFAVMFLGSPILRIEKLKTIGLGLLLIIASAGIYSIVTGGLFTKTQSSRFDFFDPCSKYTDGGYQVCNGFIAINSGGLFGVGLGQSKQVTYIPEAHTDSVFAIIAEENGFIKCTIIFIIYIVILFRILKISTNSNTIRGQYIALGIATYIFLHILINLGGLFGVMPLTGIPLPFLSYGGSYTLSLIISLAVVQRIHIEKEQQKIILKKR
ncbi:MAG: FtsW/RodA/SpoVE family cell cycle protein [Bacilli bacterium]